MKLPTTPRATSDLISYHSMRVLKKIFELQNDDDAQKSSKLCNHEDAQEDLGFVE
jgi:hypothetical protein